jgi:hypothetical protein
MLALRFTQHLASPINDDQDTLTSLRHRMGCAGRNDVNLTLLDYDHLIVDLELQLAFQDKQRFVEVMRLVRIGKLVHAKYFDIGTCGLADDGGAPRVRQLRCLKQKIAPTHGKKEVGNLSGMYRKNGRLPFRFSLCVTIFPLLHTLARKCQFLGRCLIGLLDKLVEHDDFAAANRSNLLFSQLALNLMEPKLNFC